MGTNSTKSNQAEVSRDSVIIRTSIIGIITNVFLAAFKAAVGLLSNSIAVTWREGCRTKSIPWDTAGSSI